MRLLIHDTLTTAPLLFPFTAAWLASDVPFEPRSQLRAGDLAADDLALLPSAEVATLQETHLVVPDIAVIADQTGAIAMRAPVRPDEIARTPVRLWEASGTAELVARATLQPYYGILPTVWTSDDSAEAQVVIVEGAEAIRAPEAGFAEDLVRAWFILTGQPLVTHLLVVPKSLDRDAVRPAVDMLRRALDVAQERRRDLRRALAERFDLDRDRLAEVWQATRFTLEESDRRALLMLLQRGNRGSAYPYVWEIPYLEPDEGVSD